MEKEFKTPEFLANEDYDSILSRMLSKLPENISKEDNGWICDLFSPVAIEHARAIQFVLVEAIKNIIPKYSYGNILLGHGENRGIFKREATRSRAVLTVKGIKGTVIPKGYRFSTTSDLETPAVVFYTLNENIIPETGVVDIALECEILGKTGNTAAETIILMVKPLKGIVSVKNKNPAYGGFDEETEDSIRQRIAEFDISQNNSFVGSYYDYRRWAMEVEGVGNANVIANNDESGIITIMLTDLNGQPAGEEVCNAVYNYIMRLDLPYERLAPINAVLSVVPAKTINISVSADLILRENFNVETVKSNFEEKLNIYLKENTIIKYSEIGALIINTNGVYDYSNMLLNNDTQNIIINNGYIPVIKTDGVDFRT